MAGWDHAYLDKLLTGSASSEVLARFPLELRDNAWTTYKRTHRMTY